MFGIMKAWNWKHIPVAVYMSIQNIQIQYQLIVNYMLYNVVLYAMNLSAWSSILGLWNHALVDTVCNQADPIQHNNMCFQLEFVSRYWQGQTVERREQLTVVPYIQPLACPFVGSEPSSPLPSHEILRWSNAVAARGMEKLPLHELCEYKKSLRWTSLIRWTSLNFIDFAHRSSSPHVSSAWVRQSTYLLEPGLWTAEPLCNQSWLSVKLIQTDWNAWQNCLKWRLSAE